MRIWICLFPFLLLLLPPLLLNSMADHVAECDALLHFSNSFTISKDASEYYCDNHFPTYGYGYYYSPTSYPKTASWKNGTDCCWWDGVTCHPATNQVIGLDLSCSWLRGPLLSNSTLFLLTGLQKLNLAGNDLNGSRISPKFGIFTGMAHLNLSNSGFSGPVPLEMICKLSNLTILDLSDYHASLPYYGRLSIEDHSFRGLLQNLTRLRELVLDRVDMSKVHPISLTNLSSTLTSLSLSYCYLQGVFPIDIFHLPNLQSLSLSSNDDLTGTLPQTNWTGPLVSLDLFGTNFHGSIPASIGNLTTMNYLELSISKLAGVFPHALGNLQHLTYLGLSFNNLSGTVDFEMFARLRNLQYLSLGFSNLTVLLKGDGNCSFPRLQILELFGCKLTEFPYFLRSSTKLKKLDISDNMISGTIPDWFRSVARDTLTILVLSSNNFTGYISPSICKSSSLEVLSLSSNRLNGTIPICLGNLSGISLLDLSQNLLQGPLPRSLANCLDMQHLDVSYNAIRDTFPNWIINASRGLRYLLLQSNGFHGVIEVPLPPRISELSISSNNFSGYLPTDFLLNSSAESIDMANNNFDGPLPINFLLNSSAQLVDMANNNFYGPLPIPPPTVVYYLLSDNKFGGRIPHHACNASQLEIIDLSNHSLIGTIPQCFKNISASLSVLDLRANKLTGQIPEIFIPKASVQTIRLSKNQFGGTLPHSLAHCEELEVLDLSENELEDRFPYWLDTLPNLHVLVLRSNKFYGPVDGSSKNGHPFPKLHIFDISANRFLGPLPAKYLASLIAMKNEEKSGLHYMGDPDSYYRDSIEVVMKGWEFELVKILTVFTSIDFSSNFFEGEIPKVIGDLKALKGLNFSHNNLSGNIPASVGNLTNLEWLDLSSNKLNGTIPGGLADLASLEVLNLSNNQLMGPIPRSTQFDTFGHSFDGNPGLCGRPLPKLCRSDTGETPPSTSHEEEETESDNWIEWRAVPLGYGCGLILGILIGYIVLETGRPRWLARMIERKISRKTRRQNKNISLRNHGRYFLYAGHSLSINETAKCMRTQMCIHVFTISWHPCYELYKPKRFLIIVDCSIFT